MESSCSELENNLRCLVKHRKTIILCVGNALRGDDGAGHLLARKLLGRVNRLNVLDSATTPQDNLEEVLRLRPDVVIFVDAADRLLGPGTITLEEIRQSDTKGSSLITHKFPLTWVALLVRLIGMEQGLAIRTVLITIQISSTTTEHATRLVRESVSKLLELFERLDRYAKEFEADQGVDD